MITALLGHNFLMEANDGLRKGKEEGQEGQITALFDRGVGLVEIGRTVGLHHIAVYRKLVKAGRVPNKR